MGTKKVRPVSKCFETCPFFEKRDPKSCAEFFYCPNHWGTSEVE